MPNIYKKYYKIYFMFLNCIDYNYFFFIIEEKKILLLKSIKKKLI